MPFITPAAPRRMRWETDLSLLFGLDRAGCLDMVNREVVYSLHRPAVNLGLARKLTNSLNKLLFIDLGADTEREVEAASQITALPELVSVNGQLDKPKKKRNGPGPNKVMERFMPGWRIRDIGEDQECSEGYVYKLIKTRKGISAMDLRWTQWALILAMYHAEPKITFEEIEKTFGVTRAAVYHAVRKIAKRDGKNYSPGKRKKANVRGQRDNKEQVKQRRAQKRYSGQVRHYRRNAD